MAAGTIPTPMPPILDAYLARTAQSAAAFERADRVMPAGNTRAAAYFAPYPVTLRSGAGFEVEDVDGNRYIDLLSNYTSLIHGHAHPAIDAAVAGQLNSGMVFPSPTQLQAELAAVLATRFGSVEQTRFTNSGTEAVMVAIRAARAHTGRDRLITIAGGYHGSWDQVAAFQELDEASGRPRRLVNRGIPAAIRDLVTSVRYNDIEQLTAAFSAHGADTAALIMEPVIGEQTVPADLEFLTEARRLCDAHGVVLIFDEVVTARLHHGGVQGWREVYPDLTAFGKIIGGGLPIGAVGGSAALMSVFDTRGPEGVPHHGTYNGNNLSMVAGLASLELLSADEIARINHLGDRLATGLRGVFADAGRNYKVTQVGSLLLVHAAAELERLHLATLLCGLYMAPRGLICVSTPMSDGVIDEAVARMAQAVGMLNEEEDR